MSDPEFTLRPLRSEDNPNVAKVIRTVMPEFGASGPGFAIVDPEVDHMFEAYSKPGHAYFVLERDGRIVGGAGVGALVGGEPGVCELRKMYFLQEARGRGEGQRMLKRCLEAAKALGYRTMYLETLNTMTGAMKLYERLGFQPLCAPMGATGHFGCDRWYAREID